MICTLLVGWAFFSCQSERQGRTAPCRADEAIQWQKRRGWLHGSNFLPSTAINQLEMCQAETFDPATIDRELGWAADIGMNCMRVYLHPIWQNHRSGFMIFFAKTALRFLKKKSM